MNDSVYISLSCLLLFFLRALVLSLYNGNTIRVVKFGKKDGGTLGNFQTVIDFPKVVFPKLHMYMMYNNLIQHQSYFPQKNICYA